MRTWIPALMLAACGTPSDPAEPGPVDPGEDPPAVAVAVGHCVYTNPFSQADECKEYLGADWTIEAAEADSAAPVPGGAAGAFTADEACARDEVVGECVIDGEGPLETVLVFWGDDPGACAGAELGCGFSGGEFVPGDVCSGTAEPEGVPSEQAFQPFELVCVDVLPGDPPGSGENGQVCTWEAVSGATEAGRRFVEYASCDRIYTQRPYYAYESTPPAADPDDPRLDDPAWVAEFAWVTAQFEATSCACCHTDSVSPDGASGWSLEDEPIWLDGVDDDGLAMLAGWVDSTAFGAFEPEDNNGFDRSVTGVPTTDVPRMVAFLEGELAGRGLTPDDFVDTPPFGGVLYDQLFYDPEPCENGEGVGADGTLTWTGGPARYLYVLEADSDSPGVPPNLDLPDGTLWRADVDWTDPPVASGVPFGGDIDGATVTWPLDGEAPALVSGQSYYLVALLDVYQPATRCLFVAP